MSKYDAIRELQKEYFENSCNKGFWDDFPESAQEAKHYIGNKLMLIVSEVAEAHDDLRSNEVTRILHSKDENGKPVGLPSELADIVIRTFDLAESMSIDLATVMEEKAEYNATRPYKHGKAF